MSLIATGAISGEIAIYDYEKSNLLDFCIAHGGDKGEITGLHFLWPYPLLLSTGLDSQVCIWKVRSVGEERRTVECLYRFENLSFKKDIWGVAMTPIYSSCLRYGKNLKGIHREKKNKTNEQVIIGASSYREFKANVVLSQMESFISQNDKGKFRGPDESERLRTKLIANYKTVNKNTGRNKIDTIFDKMVTP